MFIELWCRKNSSKVNRC